MWTHQGIQAGFTASEWGVDDDDTQKEKEEKQISPGEKAVPYT